MTYHKGERGQALVELLALLPIILIALSGFVAVISLQRRIFIENLVRYNVETSLAAFGKKERLASQWKPSLNDNEATLIADLTTNTPLKVFRQKGKRFRFEKTVKIVNGDYAPRCRDNLIISQEKLNSDNPKFSINGCSDAYGWTKVDSSFFSSKFSVFPLKKELTSSKQIANSPYIPQNEMAFSKRSHLARFVENLRPPNFDSQYAASGAPQNNQNLNRDCLFNPYAHPGKCFSAPNIGNIYLSLATYSIEAYDFQFAACAAELALRDSLIDAFLNWVLTTWNWSKGKRGGLCNLSESVFELNSQMRKAYIRTMLLKARAKLAISEF